MAKLTPEQIAERPWLYQKGEGGGGRGLPPSVRDQIKNNAIRATRLRDKFLSTLESRIATVEVMADLEVGGDATERDLAKARRVMELLGPDVNKLMVDSENRGFGAPRQILDIDDRREKMLEEMTDGELAEIAAGGGDDIGDEPIRNPDEETTEDEPSTGSS